ncbi:MAG: sulfide dehydrogenase [Chlorobiaceae bacterium]|nr:sulfide dehydrogenase [Chlorobiaceae bacterium]NTV59923.1 sulfide dehydrogenase [Chlorobiaceae bacterium]
MAANLRLWLAACAFSAAALLPGSVASAANTSEVNPRGLVLSLSCSSCHGTDGKSVGLIPPINGRSTSYIESAMLAFKSGARYSTVMSRHAKGYTDAEIRLIAEYFGRFSRNK